MKKLILIFLFISAFVFGQEKTLFKAVSYNNLIELYNQNLHLQKEDLNDNIARCKLMIAEAKNKADYKKELVYTFYLNGLSEAKATADKNKSFISIYQDPKSYSFYDSKDKFVARLDKLKMEEQIAINGNNTETYLQNYFYLSQD